MGRKEKNIGFFATMGERALLTTAAAAKKNPDNGASKDSIFSISEKSERLFSFSKRLMWIPMCK